MTYDPNDGCDCPYCAPWAKRRAASASELLIEPCECHSWPDAVVQNDGHVTGCVYSRATYRGGRSEELDDF